jgi:hypothetical protein
LSTKTTFAPALAALQADQVPAGPPPITNTSANKIWLKSVVDESSENNCLLLIEIPLLPKKQKI